MLSNCRSSRSANTPIDSNFRTPCSQAITRPLPSNSVNKPLSTSYLLKVLAVSQRFVVSNFLPKFSLNHLVSSHGKKQRTSLPTRKAPVYFARRASKSQGPCGPSSWSIQKPADPRIANSILVGEQQECRNENCNGSELEERRNTEVAYQPLSQNH